MRAVFLRHEQSTGNAGIPCHNLLLIELTEKGHRQAREVAAAWTEAPSLIVTSPCLRTRQAAEPTMKRFPQVPIEKWPIQEFTYLKPSRWNGTSRAWRLPHLEAYWAKADPEYCDGPGAESFATLLHRAKAALRRLKKMPESAVVYVFSHGQFMQAVRSLVLDPELSDQERMKKFWRREMPPAIRNAERIELEWKQARWQLNIPQRESILPSRIDPQF